MIEAPYDALIGEYGLAWQVVSWGVTVPVLLIGLLAWLLLLDRKFGWGLTGSLPDSEPTVSSEEVLAYDANHGAAENGHKAPDGGEAGPDALRALVRWVPHPDDPPPTEASPRPSRNTRPPPPRPHTPDRSPVFTIMFANSLHSAIRCP